MVRFDDFPALLADPSGFWAKTLHEGRWVNYLWHLREVVTPSWLNFAVYQTLWALFAAALGVAALGRQQGALWFAGVLALMIVIAPPATLISLWFNTLIPGLGLVALYAVLGCCLSPLTHRALLPVFVVLTFMAYTTYPLLLLAVCLVRSDTRSLRDLVGLLGLFCLSFGAAVLAVYTLNLQVHGVFGVPLADWRAARPAADLAGVWANLPMVAPSLGDFVNRASFGFGPAVVFHLAVLCIASAVLARRAPLEAVYLHAGLWMGMALMVVQIVKTGAIAPPRAFIFAWVFYALIVVRAAHMLSTQPGWAGRMGRNCVLLIVGSYALQTFQQYGTYRAWQAETRALAQVVAATDGAVALYGDVLRLPSAQAAFVQDPLGLSYRMTYLAGQGVRLCSAHPSDCAGMTPALRVDVVHDATGARLSVSKPSAPQD